MAEKSKDKSGNPVIVALGASAGGLEALESFFRNVRTDTRFSFVVIQHLSPDYKSMMAELISKYTDMEVMRAGDDLEVQPNKVYLIPPNNNLTVFHNKLYLTKQKNHNLGINLPIDIFFRSLAEDSGERSVGIILSGTGSDGTLGIRAIKGAGCIVMVQDEKTAKFDGMPKSAVSTGMVDFISTPEEMAEKLYNYKDYPFFEKSKPVQTTQKDDKDHYTKVLSLIKVHTGTDFTYYKPSTIVRRIQRRMSINRLDDIESYVDIISSSSREVNILYKDLLIGVTKFFRDPESFSVIEKQIIPQIFENHTGNEPLKFWVVGCSTGEEAYSMAILIREYMEKHNVKKEVKVFATDIDKDSVEYASAGVYPESIIADVSMERLKNYFIKKGNYYKVQESLRQMIVFANHNIIKDPPFSKLDFISCRNLLIYLEPIMQKKVLSAFSFSLKMNGYLFLGTSESLGELADSFSTVNLKSKIYRNINTEKLDLLYGYKMPSFEKNEKHFHDYEIADPKPESNDTGFKHVIEKLFDHYVPAAVVIDDKYNLIHSFNDADKFLQVPKGKMNLNFTNMLPDDLAIPVTTALHKVSKHSKLIKYNDINFSTRENYFNINLKIIPVPDPGSEDQFIVVVFEENEKKNKKTDEDLEKHPSHSKDKRVDDLKQELKYTKENLQATVEELETSNEELQATNEELVASNEELQSTNEELQSVNEELYTVNSEHQKKIDELTELNNDINNWFRTSHIATIFLDLKMRIRKYTPEIENYVNIIKNDVGRQFGHLSYNFEYENFTDDVEKVLEDLQPVENEVRTKGGKFALVKITPYRTVENAVKGVVITFIDVTSRVKQRHRLERERELLINVLDNSPFAKLMVNKEGFITYANKPACSMFNMSRDEMMKLKFNSDTWSVTDKQGNKIPNSKRPFSLIKKTGKPVKGIEEYVNDEKGKRVKLTIRGAPILNESNNVEGAVFAIDKG